MTNAQKKQAMYNRFGKDENNLCKECSNLLLMISGKRAYWKCKCFGVSSSTATDFSPKGCACGMFCKDFQGTPVYTEHIVWELNKEETLF